MSESNALNIDDVPGIIKIRHFADKQLDELAKKYLHPDGYSTVDKELLASVFDNVYDRYLQAANIAPGLYQMYAKALAQLEEKHSRHYIKAKQAESDLAHARAKYLNAIRRMKHAYLQLNDTKLEYALNEAITSFSPRIERLQDKSNGSESWRSRNDG
jgi:hypothetical protein